MTTYIRSDKCVLKADRVSPTPASAIGTGAVTLTIAQLLTEILEEDPAGAVNWTLPTAALLVAGIPNARVGSWFDFFVINNATTTVDEPITIVAGGATTIGNLVVENDTIVGEINSGSAHFRIRVTNVTSAAEAYSCYRLA